jgi:hypothetical protein
MITHSNDKMVRRDKLNVHHPKSRVEIILKILNNC